MSKTSLNIIDGNSSAKALEVESSSLGFVPAHYVSSSENSYSVWVTSSANYPVAVTGSLKVADSELIGGKNVLLVKPTGSTAVNGNVTVANAFFDDAVVAISHSYYTSEGGASNSLAIKLRDKNSYTFDENHQALLVRTSGSAVTIDNSGFTQLVNGLTASLDQSDNSYKLKVKITGSTEDSPVYVTGTLNTNLLGVNKYGVQSGGAALVVKITGSSESDAVAVSGAVDIGVTKYGYTNGAALVVKVTASTGDTYPVQLSNVATAAFSEGQALVVRVTSSNDSNPVYVTGNINIGIGKYGYSEGEALVTKITASATQDSPFWVTGTVTTTGGAVVSDGLKVELSGTNVKQLSGSSSNTYLQTSIAPVATTSTLRSYVLPNWGGPVPTGDANVILFDWSIPDSGTVCAASSSVTRKSLTIFNDSQYNVYFMIGLPHAEQTNGFNLYSITNRPNAYSFVLYPSGTYFAEPHNVGMRHSMYLVSGSLSGETKISVTETY